MHWLRYSNSYLAFWYYSYLSSSNANDTVYYIILIMNNLEKAVDVAEIILLLVSILLMVSCTYWLY